MAVPKKLLNEVNKAYGKLQDLKAAIAKARKVGNVKKVKTLMEKAAVQKQKYVLLNKKYEAMKIVEAKKQEFLAKVKNVLGKQKALQCRIKKLGKMLQKASNPHQRIAIRDQITAAKNKLNILAASRANLLDELKIVDMNMSRFAKNIDINIKKLSKVA